MNITMDENEDTRNKYDKWLDEYNGDPTQPYEIPSTYELLKKFPTLNRYEAGRIVFEWLENSERKLGGG